MPACLCVYNMHLVPTEARRGYQVPRTGVTGSCKPLYGFWEPKPHLLQEHLGKDFDPLGVYNMLWRMN